MKPVNKQDHNISMKALCKMYNIEGLEIKIDTNSFSMKLKKTGLKTVSNQKVEEVFKIILSILH